MDPVTLFGLFAVTAMLVFLALEDHSPWCTLGFACAVRSARCTVFCRVLGGSASSRRYGLPWRCAAGGARGLPNPANHISLPAGTDVTPLAIDHERPGARRRGRSASGFEVAGPPIQLRLARHTS